MKLTKKQLFHKVEDIAKQVKSDLRKKGYVIPIKERNGTINLDGVRVRKIKETFYSVYDRQDRAVIENLNSLQTAIVLANRLALNKSIDDLLVEADRQFGFQSFKLEVAETRIKTVPLHSEKWFYYDTRRKIAQDNTKKHLDVIQKSYKNLANLR